MLNSSFQCICFDFSNDYVLNFSLQNSFDEYDYSFFSRQVKLIVKQAQP